MARKRKNLNHLDYNSAEYWNRLLVQEGLALDRGKSSKVIYVGGATDIEMLELLRRTDTGLTPAKKTGWPEDE